MIKITQKELKEILHYDPETGVFTWRVLRGNNGKMKIGDVAGYEIKAGYIEIGINYKAYYAHRLAFLYVEGYIPENDVDHIDRNPSNNKWDNLRHVSRSCNLQNRKIQKRNKSGVTGVNWNKPINKWMTQITINKKQIHLGYYKSLTKAIHARYKAEVKYEYPNCNSTSTAYLYLKEKGLVN